MLIFYIKFNLYIISIKTIFFILKSSYKFIVLKKMEVLSNRICAIQKDITISEDVVSLAKERFKKDLSLAYEQVLLHVIKPYGKKQIILFIVLSHK